MAKEDTKLNASLLTLTSPARAYVLQHAGCSSIDPRSEEAPALYGVVPFIAHIFFYVCLTDLTPWTMRTAFCPQHVRPSSRQRQREEKPFSRERIAG